MVRPALRRPGVRRTRRTEPSADCALAQSAALPLVPMVAGPPGAAGPVVALPLAPREVADAMAVHRHAEVVAIGEPEARLRLVGRAGPAIGDAGGWAPRGSPVHGCAVPDVPCLAPVAVVFPGDPEVAGPRSGRDRREVGSHAGAVSSQVSGRAPGNAVG